MRVLERWLARRRQSRGSEGERDSDDGERGTGDLMKVVDPVGL